MPTPPPPGARVGPRHTVLARRCAHLYLSAHSTSFSLACRLLAPDTRPHVTAIYAWARVADEIVDSAEGPGQHDDPTGDAPGRHAAALLAEYRERTYRALARGYESDPIVHAFALTARAHGIGERLVEPFFESMAADLEVRVHTPESLARYIHGSAEVIGEMCLRTFAGGGLGDDPDTAAGARALGAAFQKVNFLRDVHEDWYELGRNYLPGRDPAALTDRDLAELTGDIDADLATARRAMAAIPGRDRLAVRAAHDLFAELNARLRAAGPAAVCAGRVRVPDARKLALLGRTAATALRSPA